jgi:hypothetical protein
LIWEFPSGGKRQVSANRLGLGFVGACHRAKQINRGIN